MNKKGVELSVNTIIVIVIVLLILLVMAFLLTGGFQNFTTSTSCNSKQNHRCEVGSCPEGTTPAGWTCPNKGEVCCGPSLFAEN